MPTPNEPLPGDEAPSSSFEGQLVFQANMTLNRSSLQGVCMFYFALENFMSVAYIHGKLIKAAARSETIF
jgi:hypothetical protein